MHSVEGPRGGGRICCWRDREGQYALHPLATLVSTKSISQLPLNLVLLKNIAVLGIHWGAYSRKRDCTGFFWTTTYVA